MLSIRSFSRPASLVLRSSRLNSTLALAVQARDPSRVALVAPRQNIKFTYGDLSNRVVCLAGSLSQLGYTKGDVIATDLASCAENLLLQLAASHLGASVMSLKGPEVLEKLSKTIPVRGAVADNKDSFLLSQTFALPHISVEPSSAARKFSDLSETSQDGTLEATSEEEAPLGYYGSATPVTQAMALTAGRSAKDKLNMKETDVVLVSITLNHIFGIGSAVSSALQSGAAIVLPDASGIVGCGSPSQRAEAIRNYLGSLDCTLLFADTHTLKALKAAGSAELQSLRGGVCKIGSGTDFLADTEEYAGITLATMGKK